MYLRSGLISGSVAAIVAALVSLPLRSPLDSYFNSASVVLGGLAAGLIAAGAWSVFSNTPKRRIYYAGVLGGGLGTVTLLAAIGDTQVDRLLSFSAPLAAIAFIVSGWLVPVLERNAAPKLWWSTPAAVVIALGLGIGLAGQGDEKSGELALPARSETPSTLLAAEPKPGAHPTATATLASVATEERTTTVESPTAPKPDRASPTQTPGPPRAGEPDQRLKYVVVEGSEATFTVGEQLARLSLPNDAVMRTSELTGEVNLGGGPSAIQINLSTLKSDQNFRDRYVRTRMFGDSPIATFTVDDVGEIPDGFYVGETVKSKVTGTLSIRGKGVPLTFELEVRNDGDTLHILGRTTFTWEELQIPRPTARIVVYVEDEVSVQILLKARASEASSDG